MHSLRVGLVPTGDNEPNIRHIQFSGLLGYMLGFKSATVDPSQATISVTFKYNTEAYHTSFPINYRRKETSASDFEAIDTLIRNIQNSGGERVNCKFRFKKGKVMLKLMSGPANILFIKLTENLQSKLGLIDNIIYPTSLYAVGESTTPSHFIAAEDVPDLRSGRYSLFIYCDVIAPQIIGNTISPIIQVVSIAGTYGDVTDQHYDNPHDVPILKREFDSIKININDDTGQPVNFHFGKIFVKLHFRKTRL